MGFNIFTFGKSKYKHKPSIRMMNTSYSYLTFALILILFVQVNIKLAWLNDNLEQKFIFFFVLKKIDCSGKVAIQLVSFSNPTDFDYRGVCCNGDQILLSNQPICSRGCNTLITLCLDNYESSADFNVCPYGARNLSAINDKSSIEFTTPTAGDVENPVLIPFSNNYQVCSFFF
jgi:hypothetical protein